MWQQLGGKSARKLNKFIDRSFVSMFINVVICAGLVAGTSRARRSSACIVLSPCLLSRKGIFRCIAIGIRCVIVCSNMASAYDERTVSLWRSQIYGELFKVSINEAESKLNLLYMGMCSTRPRTGVKPFWRYSIANRDHGQYKMTHSSFWEYRNKVCQYYSPAWYISTMEFVLLVEATIGARSEWQE